MSAIQLEKVSTAVRAGPDQHVMIDVSKKKQAAPAKKTVANLEAKDCRWPIGDPREADFHFCGAAQLPGRPYCQHHWHMAFQPSAPRDRSRSVVLPSLKAA